MLADPGNLFHTSSCSPGTRPRGHRPYSQTSAPTKPHTLLPIAPGSAQAQAQAQDTWPVGTAQPIHRPVQGSQAAKRPCLFINSHAAPAGTRKGPIPRSLSLRRQNAGRLAEGLARPGPWRDTGTRGQAFLTILWPSESGGLRTLRKCPPAATGQLESPLTH